MTNTSRSVEEQYADLAHGLQQLGWGRNPVDASGVWVPIPGRGDFHFDLDDQGAWGWELLRPDGTRVGERWPPRTPALPRSTPYPEFDSLMMDILTGFYGRRPGQTALG